MLVCFAVAVGLSASHSSGDVEELANQPANSPQRTKTAFAAGKTHEAINAPQPAGSTDPKPTEETKNAAADGKTVLLLVQLKNTPQAQPYPAELPNVCWVDLSKPGFKEHNVRDGTLALHVPGIPKRDCKKVAGALAFDCKRISRVGVNHASDGKYNLLSAWMEEWRHSRQDYRIARILIKGCFKKRNKDDPIADQQPGANPIDGAKAQAAIEGLEHAEDAEAAFYEAEATLGELCDWFRLDPDLPAGNAPVGEAKKRAKKRLGGICNDFQGDCDDLTKAAEAWQEDYNAFKTAHPDCADKTLTIRLNKKDGGTSTLTFNPAKIDSMVAGYQAKKEQLKEEFDEKKCKAKARAGCPKPE